MMSYTIRKFRKVLKDGSPEDVQNFIDKKNDPYFVYIFRWLHDLESLKLYNDKIGLKNIIHFAHWDILISSKFKKGKFLIESGLNPHIKSSSGYSLLPFIKDFKFFKYLVEDIKVKVDVEEVLNKSDDPRIIKYMINYSKNKSRPKYIISSRSIIKTKILEENGFCFNEKSINNFKGIDNINYLFDITKDEEMKFEFLKNQAITPYILKTLFLTDEEKTKEGFKKHCRYISHKTSILAYELGILNIFREEDELYNFFGNYSGKSNILFLKGLPQDVRRKLLNERNHNNESFLWSSEALRDNNLNDIKYLIDNGLEFNFLNNKGESFLEKARTNLNIKQYFINLGLNKNLEKTAKNNTYGQELNKLDDYINYSIKNKIPLCLDLLQYFIRFDSTDINYKNIVKMFSYDFLGIKKAFLNNHNLFKDALIENKKIVQFIISILGEDINKADIKGVYLPYSFSPNCLEIFVKEGFDINLVPNDIKSIQKYMDKSDAKEFIEKSNLIKLGIENKELHKLIKENSIEKSKKRI